MLGIEVKERHTTGTHKQTRRWQIYQSMYKRPKNVCFKRNRKLLFKIFIILLTRGMANSLQQELDSFSKEVMGGDFNI